MSISVRTRKIGAICLVNSVEREREREREREKGAELEILSASGTCRPLINKLVKSILSFDKSIFCKINILKSHYFEKSLFCKINILRNHYFEKLIF